ncbi:MAG: transporter ATP-binding protein [Myxococcaceae bacterium]|nr:transporter ATP-binding protein [Myxococcaceae bacterium]
MSVSGKSGVPALALENIALSFGAVRALHELSFSVAPGEICAVIGPNGAGKSSLLNVISGVYRADRGSIRLAGEPVPAADPRAAARLGIARTFQNIALFKGMSVLDNVVTGRAQFTRASVLEQALRIGRARAEERQLRARAEQVLELLEIQRHRHAIVGKLPYGLQKRVELARALIAAPKLLLLDEPMAGMTFHEKEDMCRFIAEAQAELHATVLLIEHDMGVVMDLSDRVVVLDYGRLITVDTPSAVQRDPRVIEAYLGVAS